MRTITNMKVVFTQTVFGTLRTVLPWDGKEKTSFLLCNSIDHQADCKLLPYKVVVPGEEDFNYRRSSGVQVKSSFINKVYRQALEEQAHVMRCHTHPPGCGGRFSGVDLAEEPPFFKHMNELINGMVHASMVLAHDHSELDAWFYDPGDGQVHVVDKVLIPGPDGLEIIIPTGREKSDTFASNSGRLARSIEAYGEEAMRKLGELDIAVVGASGLGSPVIEMLARDGVRKITICDPDHIDESNLNRLLGVTPKDIGVNKARYYADRVAAINPNVEVEAIPESFYPEAVQRQVAMADVVIGCVDNGARLACNVLCQANRIPYFDLGAGVVTANDREHGFTGGQVCLSLPDVEGCLDCSGFFDGLKSDFISESQRKQNQEMGYVKNVEAPLVMPLDATIAGAAVNELHEYVWGKRSENYFSLNIDLSSYKMTRTIVEPDICWVCKSTGVASAGDKAPFLAPSKDKDIQLPEGLNAANDDHQEECHDESQ